MAMVRSTAAIPAEPPDVFPSVITRSSLSIRHYVTTRNYVADLSQAGPSCQVISSRLLN
jgi:hypothetical protein